MYAGSVNSHECSGKGVHVITERLDLSIVTAFI
jgi:hypothetical protein